MYLFWIKVLITLMFQEVEEDQEQEEIAGNRKQI